MITIICQQCKKEFQAINIRKDKAKFCSYQCYWNDLKGKRKKEPLTKKCLICQKEFEVQPYRRNIAKYCSHQCEGKSRKGKPFFDSTGIPAWNKGKKGIMPPQCGFQKGHPQYNYALDDWRKDGGIPYNKGKKWSETTSREAQLRVKIEAKKRAKRLNLKPPILKGENHPNWKNGITKLTDLIRQSDKNRKWDKSVREKYNYVCQKCGKQTRDWRLLVSHHIKSFSNIIHENKIKTLEEALNCEELWNIDNGTVLCQNKCHKEFHRKYGKGNNTKQQLEEFLSQ